MEVAPGIYRAESDQEVAYVLDCGGAYVMVDVGSEAALSEKLDQFRADGLDTGHIAALLITHSHDHHAGAVPALRATASPRVVAHRLAVRALRHCPAATPLREDLVAYTVDEGDSVEIGDLAFEVHHLPGHSPDSVAWHLGESLFVGDLIRCDGTIGAMALDRGACVSDYRSSLQRLLRIEATTLYPGHGDCGFLRRAAVEQALEHLSALARADRELVSEGRPALRRGPEEHGKIVRLPTGPPPR
jgi:glyoxylase-like metal-dependent hydrolase (beta-lactamase superfamily II)